MDVDNNGDGTCTNVDQRRPKCDGKYCEMRSTFLAFIYVDTIGTEVVCSANNVDESSTECDGNFHL